MKISLPSIQKIADDAYLTLARFPFVMMSATVASIAAVWYSFQSYDVQQANPEVFKLMFVGFLGISWMYACRVFAEQQNWARPTRLAFKSTAFLMLFIYFFVLRDDLTVGPYDVWYRMAMLFVITHLFAAFSPFISTGSVDQFWEYNKTIFLRFLLSGIYSGVLYIGLSVALMALDVLLGFDIDDRSYLALFFILGGVFNTWFFLAGVPDKESIRSNSIEYPKGLRVFVQFVLIPLVTAYILILYAYLAKIIIEWNLPNGWVTYLVLSFSIVGILSLLLLHPVKEDSDKQWIKWFSTGYYRALIPLVVLLLFSIWVRIDDYGVTINRFIVATLGVWLTIMVVYFTLSKSKSIMIIPISLCVITLGTAFGPFSAFSVSGGSQLDRFEQILNEHELINQNGFAVPASVEIPLEARKELSSIVDYVSEHHGITAFQPMFEEDIEMIVDDELYQKRMGFYDPGLSDPTELLASINIEFTDEWVTAEYLNESRYFEFSAESGVQENDEKYDYSIHNIEVNVVDVNQEYAFAEHLLLVQFNPDEFEIEISLDNEATSAQKISLFDELGAFDYKITPSNNYKAIPLAEMTFESKNEWLSLRLVFNSLSGMLGDEQQLNRAKFNLYVKIIE
ncbi:MAG: DUF4153 domain-containing protein [Balneolaceae bacterium]|nr:DUF4153 domain-containing protein [Balneolaceae bacterium]